MEDRNDDAVDRIVAAWREARPDLDLRAMETIGRLGRTMQFVHRLVEARLLEFGLSVGDFDVLASLRRAGAPHRLTPTQLYTNLMLTSGTITNRIDRLEARGLVARIDDPQDRRGVLVSLTAEGLRMVDAAVSAHAANETRLLSVLTLAERSALDAMLRKLLRGVEAMAGGEATVAGEAKPRQEPKARAEAKMTAGEPKARGEAKAGGERRAGGAATSAAAATPAAARVPAKPHAPAKSGAPARPRARGKR